MNKDFYKDLVHQAPLGFAYHKVLFDENNKAIDYMFLEVNPLFEKLTGLKSKNIINKRVTEVIPGITQDKFDWISYYGEIAISGVEKEFEQYSQALNKHYKVQVFSPEKEYFVTLFSDISDKVNAHVQLNKVVDSSELFIKSDSTEPEYQKILDLARNLSGAKYALFNKSEDNSLDFTTIAISGYKPSFKKAHSILGFNLLDKKWKHDPVRAEKLKDQTIVCYSSLTDLIGDDIPKVITKSLEKLYGIKKTAVVRIFDNNGMFGDFLLFFDKEKGAENREILEIFAGQVYMYLKRIKANKELELSEKRYHMLLDNAGEGILEIDLEGKHTYVNPKAAQILGFTEEEMIGVSSHNLWHNRFENGTTFPKSECPIYFTLKNGEKISNEGFFIHKNGSGIHVMYTSMPLFEDGVITGAVLTFIDISIRKLAEKQIKLLAFGLESVSESVSVADLNDNLIFVNESFKRIYGYSEKEVLGKSISFLRSDENSPSLLEEIYSSSIKDGWLGEIINRRKDGTNFPILLSTSAIRDDNGKIIATLGVARDITEQKKAEQTINKQNTELKELVSTRDKFFSILSHDLRSPFGSFIGLTELMANDSESMGEEQKKTILNSLHSSAKNLNILLENLLQWSRVQSGNIPYDPKKYNLKDFAEKSLETTRESAKKKEIPIIINIPSEIKVLADENMLQLIFRNLTSNAIKFSDKGEKIIISANILNPDFAEIEVRDHGVGMNKNILENLFNITIKTNRQGTAGETSSGLGLILCKEFIEKNGGEIRVESEEGKGSSFYFTLKLAD